MSEHTDQCKHCTARGDMDTCLSLDCGHHQNWWAVEVFKELTTLKDENVHLCLVIKSLNQGLDSSVLRYQRAELRHSKATRLICTQKKAEAEINHLRQQLSDKTVDYEQLKNRYNDAVDEYDAIKEMGLSEAQDMAFGPIGDK